MIYIDSTSGCINNADNFTSFSSLRKPSYFIPVNWLFFSMFKILKANELSHAGKSDFTLFITEDDDIFTQLQLIRKRHSIVNYLKFFE